MDDNGNKRPYVTNTQLQLELKALRADALSAVEILRRDVKVWVLGAVALNQFLSSVEIPSAVTGAAVVGVLLKGAISWFARG